jgi:thiol-disulfide isomerase/thioredoxin
MAILSFVSIQAQLKIGDSIPNLQLMNTKNEEILISSFKGKLVLIDFWASWCAPCRKANKKMVQLHATSYNRIEIIGISLDKDRSKWIAAIEKDKIKYTQLIDPNGFDAKTALIFGVEELPTTYLFNNDGKLIAINPFEEQLLNLKN